MKRLFTLATIISLGFTAVACDPAEQCEEAGGVYSEELGECVGDSGAPDA